MKGRKVKNQVRVGHVTSALVSFHQHYPSVSSLQETPQIVVPPMGVHIIAAEPEGGHRSLVLMHVPVLVSVPGDEIVNLVVRGHAPATPRQRPGVQRPRQERVGVGVGVGVGMGVGVGVGMRHVAVSVVAVDVVGEVVVAVDVVVVVAHARLGMCGACSVR